ncbi:hypothetical protein AC249_AIPGENE26637 [Exaiptasia diaphana]|nr:hypothetical protein AC249_AIPGENE26637 [Exaiptasia diaphana]
MMLGGKRLKMDFSAKEVVRRAMDIKLEMSRVCPPNVYSWLKVVAKSRNTMPEFVLLSAILTTAALMGPASTVKVRSTYSEPINLYSIILSPPGSGKSQAFDLTVTSPLALLDDPPPSIVVGDHTKSGLTRHLANNHGVAIIGSDELSTFIEGLCQKKKEDVQERAFLYKLYDRRGDMGSYFYEYGNCTLEIRESRICIAGRCQVDVRSMSGRCQVDVRSMSGRCQVDVRSMSGRCQVDVRSMSGRCQVDVRSMSGRCQVDVRSMSGRCQVDVRSMSGRCGVHVRSMWGRCQVDVSKIYGYLFDKIPVATVEICQPAWKTLEFVLKKVDVRLNSSQFKMPSHFDYCWKA